MYIRINKQAHFLEKFVVRYRKFVIHLMNSIKNIALAAQLKNNERQVKNILMNLVRFLKRKVNPNKVY